MRCFPFLAVAASVPHALKCCRLLGLQIRVEGGGRVKVYGLGLAIWGSGFRFWDSGFRSRFWGSGFSVKVQGSGFRVKVLGSRVQG